MRPADLARRITPSRIKQTIRRGSSGDSEVTWQHRRETGNLQRWELITSSLDDHDRTLLDIGCNAGLLTLAAADEGLIALGIDKNRPAIESAIASTGDRQHVAFMRWEMPPDRLRDLPQCDVVLFLSVYHQWVADHGDRCSREMLATLIDRARSRFYFEPASIARKYGEHPPPIQDRDETSIVDFNLQLLRDVAPPNSAVRCLGPTPSVDSDEPFRYLFLVELPR